MFSAAPKKILILDAELTMLMTLSCTLRPDGATIVTAVRLASAEEAAKCWPFDLVIADINPFGVIRGEGLRLLSRIKQSRPETKVIVISSRPSARVEQIALDLGANYRYERPGDIPQIIMSLMIRQQCDNYGVAYNEYIAGGMDRVPLLAARKSTDSLNAPLCPNCHGKKPLQDSIDH